VTIYLHMKDGGVIPRPKAPEERVIRGRITGQLNKVVRAVVSDVAGRYVLRPYPDGETIPSDTWDFESLTYDDYTMLPEGVYIYTVWVEEAGELVEQASLWLVRSEYTMEVEVPRGSIVVISERSTGMTAYFKAVGDTAVIAYGRFVSTILKYDPEKRQAYTKVYYGGKPDVVDLGWYTRAVLTYTLRFRDKDAVLAWLVGHAAVNSSVPHHIYDVLIRPDVSVDDKITLLMPYVDIALQNEMQGRVLAVTYDPEALAVEATIYYTAGYFNISLPSLWGLIFRHPWVLGAVRFGVAALIISILAAVAAYVITHFVVEPLVKTVEPLWKPLPREVEEKITVSVERGRGEIDERIDRAEEVAKRLYEEGKMTEEAYEAVITELEEVRATCHAALEDIRDEAIKAAEEASKRGMMAGLVAGGVVGGGAGLLGGVLLGTRVRG